MTSSNRPGVQRERIRESELPDSYPARIWGGHGFGGKCSLCAAPVRKDEVEYELEFDDNEGAPIGSYHVHVKCFVEWERRRRTRAGLADLGNGESSDDDGPTRGTAQPNDTDHLSEENSVGTIMGRERYNEDRGPG